MTNNTSPAKLGYTGKSESVMVMVVVGYLAEKGLDDPLLAHHRHPQLLELDLEVVIRVGRAHDTLRCFGVTHDTRTAHGTHDTRHVSSAQVLHRGVLTSAPM